MALHTRKKPICLVNVWRKPAETVTCLYICIVCQRWNLICQVLKLIQKRKWLNSSNRSNNLWARHRTPLQKEDNFHLFNLYPKIIAASSKFSGAQSPLLLFTNIFNAKKLSNRFWDLSYQNSFGSHWNFREILIKMTCKSNENRALEKYYILA